MAVVWFFILFYNGFCHWQIHLHMANCLYKMVESKRSLLTVIILWATHTLAHIFSSNDEKSIASLSTYAHTHHHQQRTWTSDRAIWVWYYECLLNEKEWKKHAIIFENVCVCVCQFGPPTANDRNSKLSVSYCVKAHSLSPTTTTNKCMQWRIRMLMIIYEWWHNVLEKILS